MAADGGTQGTRKRPSVLILSASTGTGHLRAGEALKRAFRQRDDGLRTEHIDVLDLGPRWVRRLYGDVFELIAARAPWMWKEIYRVTDGPAVNHARWGPVAERILFRALRRLLRSGEWDACLCTHFLPSQLAAGRSDFPEFTLVVTDFTLHRFWAQPRVRRYFVATEKLAAELRARVTGAAVRASGIPIDPSFAEPRPMEEARRRLGVDPERRRILVMGGGLGIGVEDTTEAVLDAELPDVHVSAICGRNEGARERLRQDWAEDPRLRVYGYVDDMPTHIAAADLVVTKPGALTSSEVMAIGRPLLLVHPVPGHEEGNARALEAAGAAIYARETADITQAVRSLMSEPARLRQLSETAGAMGRPGAAFTIVDAYLEGPLLHSVA